MTIAACYATLPELRAAAGIKDATDTADDAALLRKAEAVSRWIDGECKRHFYVLSATKTFSPVRSDRLLLPDDLLSITTLKTDEGDDYDYDYTWGPTDYFLLPSNDWPKWMLTVKPLGNYSFPVGQDTVQIAGLWGYGDGFSATPWAATGCTITVADAVSTMVTPSDQSLLAVGQTILVDDEQMYVIALTDGGVGADSATVKRGVNGTTAVAHAAAPASVYLYPDCVREATLIQTSRIWRRKEAPFGVTGSADFGTTNIVRIDPDVKLLLQDVRLSRAG